MGVEASAWDEDRHDGDPVFLPCMFAIGLARIGPLLDGGIVGTMCARREEGGLRHTADPVPHRALEPCTAVLAELHVSVGVAFLRRPAVYLSAGGAACEEEE